MGLLDDNDHMLRRNKSKIRSAVGQMARGSKTGDRASNRRCGWYMALSSFLERAWYPSLISDLVVRQTRSALPPPFLQNTVW